jgi:hypothetical protein
MMECSAGGHLVRVRPALSVEILPPILAIVKAV